MKSYYVIYSDDKGHLNAKQFTNKTKAFDYADTIDPSRSPTVSESTLSDDLTAHDLKSISEEINNLHHSLLFSIDEDGMSPIAQTQLVIGLSLLQQAADTVKLADLYQMRGE
jgi:hypothetical protein